VNAGVERSARPAQQRIADRSQLEGTRRLQVLQFEMNGSISRRGCATHSGRARDNTAESSASALDLRGAYLV
jgi:hypothetical protein